MQFDIRETGWIDLSDASGGGSIFEQRMHEFLPLLMTALLEWKRAHRDERRLQIGSSFFGAIKKPADQQRLLSFVAALPVDSLELGERALAWVKTSPIAIPTPYLLDSLESLDSRVCRLCLGNITLGKEDIRRLAGVIASRGKSFQELSLESIDCTSVENCRFVLDPIVSALSQIDGLQLVKLSARHYSHTLWAHFLPQGTRRGRWVVVATLGTW